ncbi:forkhead box protein M1 isoform X2 [Notolabrus celidotus]|uniref:forkhead box protein M1 isoform X2 n=1 Tax=Notolabrus celidotus TaxID=1203425 RepID=UPI0014907C31|nr:forkhead box protein M1 isoform X2 [Notolabrus celidotus]XP_034528890.1 forkhead box protein M1 isoform X2 [Notolabrus celidotus]
MTMRRSPRRPLILRRRKLPFQQNDPPAAEPQTQPQPAASGPKDEPPNPEANQCFPDSIRIMDHPTMSDTQVVVIPKTADLQSVIKALTAKGKECGVQGRSKFILLCENGTGDNKSFCQLGSEASTVITAAHAQAVKAEPANNPPDVLPLTAIKPFKDLECGPLDDSLTNIQWLGKMSTCDFEPEPAKQMANKENNPLNSQTKSTKTDAEASQQTMSERPPYSYMAMIQFAINSRKSRRMTLKEIYTWIEDHFPYFREVAKPGWKNSIRHNLSLHDMFIRETSPDGKVSFWTIRPEANRCLTLDQVYRQQRRILPDARKTPPSSERRMKPLLPRTESYLIPVQLPVTSSVFMPSPQAQFPLSFSQQKQITARGAKRVRIAPKVSQSDVPAAAMYPPKSKELKAKVKEEPVSIKCVTPPSLPKRHASSSRRKQHLAHSLNDEPVLLCPENTFFDSGVVSDASTFQEMRDTPLNEPNQHVQQSSPDREFSFKTPIKSSNHLASSTPSKPLCSAAPEPWKVTPVGKGSQSVLDFSPIRTPGGPAVTPLHDYTTFSFSSTPFKDWPLFSSPRELLGSAPSRGTGITDSPMECLRSSCSRELLQAGSYTPTNRSITEGLVLDTMNDSLSKILVDISFSCMDDEDLGAANISLSEFIPHFK